MACPSGADGLSLRHGATPVKPTTDPSMNPSAPKQHTFFTEIYKDPHWRWIPGCNESWHYIYGSASRPEPDTNGGSEVKEDNPFRRNATRCGGGAGRPLRPMQWGGACVGCE